MLNIETFTLGPLGTNAYLLTTDGHNKAIVIDPGMEPESLIERIQELQLEIEAILLTHAHFDHIGGVDPIRKQFACPVYLHSAEAKWLIDPHKNGSARWVELAGLITTDPAEHSLTDGEQLNLIGLRFTILHTPGHSPGSVSIVYGDDVFGGDVLFREGVGRTDLPDGSSRDLHHSIHSKLFVLPDHVRVHPGHGPSTTIKYEKLHNPYV